MARGVNKVILVGNLGRDPEIRSMQSGSKMANFSIATSKRWKDRNTQEQKEKTAFHEAGHAVVGLALPQCDPVYKATIIPRGRALGLVLSLPERDQLSVTKTKYKSLHVNKQRFF